MKARLSKNYPLASIRLLDGRVFVKTESRPIPKELEAEALKHESMGLLETEPDDAAEIETKKEVAHVKTVRAAGKRRS